MKFGDAVEALKQGKKVKRKNWGGYWYIPNNIIAVDNDKLISFNKMIVACLKDGAGYVPATAYQEDILAEDWEIVAED